MQRHSTLKYDFSDMLAVWSELEKIHAASPGRASTQPLHCGSPQVPVPRLTLVEKSPPEKNKWAAFTHALAASPAVPLPSTPPTLHVPGTNAVGSIARSLPSSPSTPSSSSSSSSSPLGSPGNFSLPDLPDEYPDELQGQATPSSSTSSPTPRGIRRPSFMGEEAGESVREFRRRLSRKLSKMADSVAEWVQRASPRSGRNSPERLSSSGRASPLPGSPRRENSPPDGRHLPHAVVDTKVDLSDPQFLTFVTSAAEAAFIKPWTHDSADIRDINGNRKSMNRQLQPSFIRDFGNSDYRVRNEDGSLTEFADVDEFALWVGAGKGCDLPRVVSNIASQNLGNFLKNSLFLREDAKGQSQSLLRLHDGTPVMPVAIAKASYIFGKDRDGDITLDYSWESASKLNRDKLLRVKRLTGDYSQAAIADQAAASLRITTRITICRNGEWYIGDPRIQAAGWNMPTTE